MWRAAYLAALALLWAGPAAAIVVQCPGKLWAGDDPRRCPCCVVCDDGTWHIEGEGECGWLASEVEAETPAESSSDETEGLGALAVAVTILVFVSYFLPSIVASRRKHPQGNTILVINLFLGWTLIGWVVALAMAVSALPTAKK